MSIPSGTRDLGINGITPDHLSLHSSWPGVIGSNEITGGSPAYARKAVTFPASSGAGSRQTTASVTFDVPAIPVQWIGANAGATFLYAMPNGGATPRNFQVILATNQVVSTAHTYANGDQVSFFDGDPPGGLTEGVLYFVRDVESDLFKVAATSGGVAIDLTSSPSFGCVVATVVTVTYTTQDTHTVSAATEAIPN